MIIKNSLSIIRESLEYQNFVAHGVTFINLAVLIAIISFLIQAWGLNKQNKKIWQNKSGDGLPLTFFAFQFFYCVAYLIYGYKIRSAAIIINNVAAVLFIPIIIGLIKFRVLSRLGVLREMISSSLLIVTIPCVLFIDRQWSLIAILFIAGAVYTHLIIELSRKKELKNIEPKYIYSIIAGSSIWFCYGLAICDFGLSISSGSTIAAAIAFLYFPRMLNRFFKKSPVITK